MISLTVLEGSMALPADRRWDVFSLSEYTIWTVFFCWLIYSSGLSIQTRLISGMKRSQAGSWVKQYFKRGSCGFFFQTYFLDKRTQNEMWTLLYRWLHHHHTSREHIYGYYCKILLLLIWLWWRGCTVHLHSSAFTLTLYPLLSGETERFKTCPPSDSFSPAWPFNWDPKELVGADWTLSDINPLQL